MKKNKEKQIEANETPLSLAEEAENIEKEEALKKEKRKKSHGLEILRFIVVGILCTAIDFFSQFALMKWAFPSLIEQGAWGEYLSWGLSVTIAFIIANVINFVFSRLWVYQNVDKNINTKSAAAFFAYLGLGAGGWLIGLGLQELGVWVCNISFANIKITYDFTQVSFGNLFEEGGLAFWAFCIIFAIKTIVTMIYNYLTRKLIIFKEPKKEVEPFEKPSTDEPLVVTASKEEEPQKEERPHFTTKASFTRILHEEMETMFGKPYYKTYTSDARRLIHEELEAFEREHPTTKTTDQK
ncbi:MAG TPA: hypothetical protein DCZ41_00395 [Firmicutes bacterium]|nr:hypothetical protein [Bacillota bacterium]